MAIRFVDPDNTTTVRVPAEDPEAPTFTIGFWPPREAERLSVSIAKMQKIGTVDPMEDLDLAISRSGLSLDIYRSMARYSIRGWTWDGAKPAEVVPEKIGDREYPALSSKSLDALYRSKVLFHVALECMRFNTVGDAEGNGSGSP